MKIWQKWRRAVCGTLGARRRKRTVASLLAVAWCAAARYRGLDIVEETESPIWVAPTERTATEWTATERTATERTATERTATEWTATECIAARDLAACPVVQAIRNPAPLPPDLPGQAPTHHPAPAALVPLPDVFELPLLRSAAEPRVLNNASVLLLVHPAAGVRSKIVSAAATRFAGQLYNATKGRVAISVCEECLSCSGSLLFAPTPSNLSGTNYSSTEFCTGLSATDLLPDQTIRLEYNEAESAVADEVDETYLLQVQPARPIFLRANTAVGLIRALATLAQLCTAPGEGSAGVVTVPLVNIVDKPANGWRGLLVDVARHFIDAETLISVVLPLCQAVKLNVLHLHLTDDTAWRLESSAYPKLPRESIDGKFYTNNDVRRIVWEAYSRGIRVIPEINFPAHSAVVCKTIPGVCDVAVVSLKHNWGAHDTCMIPVQKTWNFARNVFTELAEIFPDSHVSQCIGQFLDFLVVSID